MATQSGLPHGWLKRTMELLEKDGKSYSQSHISNTVRRYRNNEEILRYANIAIEEINQINYEREQERKKLNKAIKSQTRNRKVPAKTL